MGSDAGDARAPVRAPAGRPPAAGAPAAQSVAGQAPARAPVLPQRSREARIGLALVLFLDAATIVAALSLATVLRSSPLLDPLFARVGWSTGADFVGWGPLQSAFALYQFATVPAALYAIGQYASLRALAPTWSFQRILLAVFASFVFLMAILFSLRAPAVPRSILLLDFLLLVAGLSGWRAVEAGRVRRRLRLGIGIRNVLFVGGDGLTQSVAVEIVRNVRHGRRIVGFLTPPQPDLAPLEATRGRPDVWLAPPGERLLQPAVVENVLRQPRHLLARVGGPEEAAAAIDGLHAEEVLLGPEVPSATVAAIIRVCQERGVDLHIIPNHHRELGVRPRPWTLGPFTLLDVHRRPMSQLGWMAKRGMDVLGGLVGLLVGSPIILATALAIKLESPRRPVFYPGRRVGLKGRVFRMAKFTTMVENAQEIEASMAMKNKREGPWFKLDAEEDPRLTRVGRFIRRYSINEIPQFWNVLKGDMSLVGPRPPTPAEVATYLDYDVRYFRCLDVKPGITGLWQVTAKNEPSFEKRIDLDLEYIQHWNVWLDLKILLRTFKVVVTDKEG